MATLTCDYKDKIENAIKKLCWLCKVAIVDSLLRSMTSFALGSWLSSRHDFPAVDWVLNPLS